MSTQQQDQHLNAGAKEIQQLNPGGPDQRQIIITTEARPGQRAIKEGSKVVNRDWVNHQACSLSQNIHVVSHFLLRIIIFSKLIRKIIPTKKKF